MRLRLRPSRIGVALAATFVVIAGALFAMHVHSFGTNLDPGESAMWFFLCTLPWAFLIPDAAIDAPWWHDVAYFVGWTLVAWNAFLLYCVAGGLTLAPRPTVQVRSSLTSR